MDRVNHNLNTSEEYYREICTTHTYADRVQTLRHVRDAGMEMCSGGIIGMGEKPEDIVSMAFDLRELGVQSIPLNFLNSIEGTPLQQTDNLTPNDCLRALAMFRFVNPDRELEDFRRSRNSSTFAAATRSVRCQQPLRRRLPHYQGPSTASRLRNDSRHGFRSHSIRYAVSR